MINIGVISQLDNGQVKRLFSLPSQKRQRLLKRVGAIAIKNSRKRGAMQQGLDGKKWAGRADKSKRKMLRKLPRYLRQKTDSDKTVIRFSHKKIGRIAAQHHDGIEQAMTAAKAQNVYGQPRYDAPATRKQAKGLREAGFKIRRKRGKGYKKTTMKWIVENMTVGQAGLVLRLLRGEESAEHWTIELPQRQFLGQTPDEIRNSVRYIFDDITRGSHGTR